MSHTNPVWGALTLPSPSTMRIPMVVSTSQGETWNGSSKVDLRWIKRSVIFTWDRMTLSEYNNVYILLVTQGIVPTDLTLPDPEFQSGGGFVPFGKVIVRPLEIRITDSHRNQLTGNWRYTTEMTFVEAQKYAP